MGLTVFSVRVSYGHFYFNDLMHQLTEKLPVSLADNSHNNERLCSYMEEEIESFDGLKQSHGYRLKSSKHCLRARLTPIQLLFSLLLRNARLLLSTVNCKRSVNRN